MPVMRVYYVYSTQYQEVFMNTKNLKSYTKVYKSWVLLGSILLVLSALTGCKGPSDSGGGGTSSQYTAVAYGDLAGYLAGASSTEVNYIEITGTIPAVGLTGTNMMGTYTPSALGAVLKASGKKIALKLPSSVAAGTSMTNCFATCENIVSVENIPAGVTDMSGCFVECTGLTGAPSIPSGVTTMHSCFDGCTSLTTAPAVPESVTTLGFCFEGCTELTNAPVVPAAVNTMFNCFNGCSKLTSVTLKCNYVAGSFNLAFNGCNALGAGSITVPQGTLSAYTGAAVDMGTTADKFKEAD